MTEPLRITVQTLTPLWTGGVDGAMDRIHEAGIVGSLRWWYEAIVRGLGGQACDPTEHPCSLSGDNLKVYEQAIKNGKAVRQALSEAKICDACQLFGCTGWRRRFRLQVSAQDQPAWAGDRNINVRPYGRNRGWYLYPGRVGAITLDLTGDEQTLAQLLALFRFLEAWGSLGPRPQLGYGVFRIISVNRTPQPVLWTALGDAPPGGLPDLRAFTFLKLRFRPGEDNWWTRVSGLRELRGRRDQWANVENLAANGMVPVMPTLKNYLRFGQQWSSVALPHWLFGTLRGDERVRSKVALSWAYRLPEIGEWEIRGWVHLPNDARGRASQAEVVNVLSRALATPQDWQTAMGLSAGFRSATIACAPSPTPWQRTGQHEIADLLNAFQSEAMR